MSLPVLPATTYVLCMVTAGVGAALLVRAWMRTRSRLLLWTAASFLLLALNNLLLVLDMLVVRAVDLWPLRAISFDAAMLVLLCGFIWEADV